MARLIDADALKKKYTMVIKRTSPSAIMERPAILLEDVDEAPTIDAEPIRHGRWIKVGDNTYRCSRCNEVSCCNGNFCTDCGAKMDEDEISNIAKESADKISKALDKVREKGMQKQNIKEDDEP